MRLRRSAVLQPVILIAFSLLTLTPKAQQNATDPSSSGKRPITEKDLFKFTWIANPQLSPDGSRVAFTRVVVDEKRPGYETSIRSEEHTSELQSRFDLVCRLLL